MDSRTAERVKDWVSRPFDGGFAELRDLADDEFSGAVEASTATLFMLNGRVVGVVDGSLDAFADASGTIYEAPHPSLPLLFAMRETGGEERAKYYTNDTPVSEANETLSSGSFTGYIELSENVLSGDYYVVYYGGRSMSCAFVGNSEELVTDDDAFQRADDEVGIYTVWDVDIDVEEIPGGDDEEEAIDEADASGAAGGAAAGAGAGAAGTDADAGAAGGQDVDTDAGTGGVGRPEAETDAGGASSTDAGGGPGGAGSADSQRDAPVQDAETHAEVTEGTDRRDRSSGPADGGDDRADRERREDVVTEAEPGGRSDERDEVSSTEPSPRRSAPSSDDAEGSAMAEVPDEVMAEVENEAHSSEFDEEEAWRETTTIPSIDPELTTEDDDASEATESTAASSATERSADSASTGRTRRQSSARSESPERGQSDARRRSSDQNQAAGRDRASNADRNRSSEQRGDQRRTASQSSQGGAPAGVDPERVSALERELSETREERDALESDRDELASERDELRDRNQKLEARVEELQAEVAELETELAEVRGQLEATASPAADASVELSPREALEGTNLFVRYGSKSATTLEDVHDRDVSVADLEGNLRLEYHTEFEADDAAVEGRPYEEFLYDSTEYGFVEWFVYDLVFEVRDTGNEDGLADLYQAFPDIDRIELFGDVSLRYQEDGEEYREQTTFDVVVRDRMGNPLVVANVNDSREPATESMMVDLEERASRVKSTSDALAAAFMVTTSYFDPGALETADEATSGSLLRRDSNKSYVKLSRKRGYHLCLVETRNGEFHVNVPEL